MNKHSLFVMLLIIFSGALLIVIGLIRFNDFKQYHAVIAQESVNNLSHDITSFISERERLVQLFSENHLDLILALIEDPNNQEVEFKLHEEVKRFFPQYFTLTLADEKGKRYLDDFDGMLGEMCITDITSYSNTNTNMPRIHPHLEAYHFDIMSMIEDKQKKVIVFISFRADLLSSVVSSAQVPGHELLLTYPTGNGLIEVTSDGPRDVLDRDSFLLTDEESARSIAKIKIAGTTWFAEDFYQQGLFKQQLQTITYQLGITYVAFVLVCLLMLQYVRREEKQRRIAEQQKSDFLSLVSHELRTPLTAISGSINLVVNGVTGNVEEKTRNILGVAQQNCSRLVLLINDLLDMQKLDVGKMQYSMKGVVVKNLLTEAINSCQDYVEQYSIEYKLVFDGSVTDPDDLYVYADANRIIQVLLNLLSNAAKYGGENDVIEVCLKQNKRDVIITITDHGDGIPDDLRHTLFEKFTRSKQHVNSKIKGTGLGLNISRQIMDDHSGDIYCDSIKDPTRFSISLPILLIDRQSTSSPVAASAD